MGGVVLLAALWAGPVQTDLLDAAQTARMKEWRRELTAANAATAARDIPKAIDATRRGLAIEREVFGHVRPSMSSFHKNLAKMHLSGGEFALAKAVRQECLADVLSLYPEGHWRVKEARLDVAHVERVSRLTPPQRQRLDEANKISARVHSLWKAGKSDEALPLAQSAQATMRELLGERHPNTLTALFNVAAQQTALKQEAAARESYRRCAALRRAALGDAHPDVAEALIGLGELHRSAGRLDDAVAAFREAFAVRLRSGEGGKRDQDAVWLLSRALYACEDFAAALPYVRHAVEIQREAGGRRLAGALGNLGGTLKGLGKAREALPAYEEARRLYEAGGGDEVGYLNLLNSLADCRRMLGDYPEAAVLLQKALARRKKVQGERHADYLTNLNNAAMLYEEMGDLREAVPMMREAARLNAAHHGGRHKSTPTLLTSQARVALSADDPARAFLHLKAALAYHAGRGGPDAAGYMGTVNDLAALMLRNGQSADALQIFRGLDTRAERLLPASHPLRATLRRNIGAARASLGRHPEAWSAMYQSLALADGGGRPEERAECLNNLAQVYHRLGHPGRALRMHREANTLSERHLAALHPQISRGLLNLARLHHAAGEIAEARRLTERAVGLSRRRAELAAAVQAERQQIGSLGDWLVDLGGLLSLDTSGEQAARDHAFVLAYKGSVFAHQEGRRRLARELAAVSDPAARRRLLRLEEVTREMAAVALSSSPDPGPLGRLEREKELLEGELSRVGSLLAERRREQAPTPGELALALPEGVVLIDLIVYRHYLPGRNSETRLSAFLSARGRPSRRVDLGALERVEKAIGAWRVRIVERLPEREAADAVRRLVWAPLKKHLPAGAAALVAPDGMLGNLPWAALPGAKAGSYLIEERAVALVTVPRLLPSLLRREAAADGPMLVVGGVRFGAGAAAAWGDLPGTEAEARAVAAAYLDRFGRPVGAVKGEDATKAAVRASLGKARYAHLATHGFIGHKAALESLRHVGGATRHPGLLTGLVFAGANKGGGEGLLTAAELSELELGRLDLAVLSACETGTGARLIGEGNLGLQRALQVAGCRSVVSSLWPVDDGATCVLMEEFYKHLWGKEKVGKLEALRRAQVFVLRNPAKVEDRSRVIGAELSKRGEAHLMRGPKKAAVALPAGAAVSPPDWWAAFVLTGDWR